MARRFPHLSVLARAAITCLALVGLGLVSQSVRPGPDVVAVRAVDSVPADVLAAALAADREPDLFAKPPLPAPTATSVPPTPTPAAATVPHWAQAEVDTPLLVGPEPGAIAEQFVPRRSYLKLLTTEGSLLRVHYGGNGDDHKPGDGWVSAGDVVRTLAPRWVETRRGATLWSGADGSDQIGALPEQAVAEVIKDRGERVQVFYLGDGFSREEAEGWVDASDLGPAGALLVSERYGVRMLTRADVQTIEEGNGIWLRVPYRTQLDGSISAEANCGPSSVAMALQLFRTSVPTGDVRNLADKLQGTSDPDGGFQIEFLAGAVERFGLKPLDLGVGPDFLNRWTLDALRRHLGQGHPVIAQLRFKAMPGRESATYAEDHYVVITGTFGDDFVYNDSVDLDGPGYGRVMSADDLKNAWGNSFFPFAGFAIAAP